ncbi:MAG: cytochrome P450 [Pseudomonadota bacterium]|nr:cytochrome P450 [Sphingomonas sp.]MDQ3470938.1 cytochrome P450 [Pseudomonadota bacterium]
MSDRFVPPHPPRGPGPVAVWRGFVGERARTAVYGWSQAAFDTDYLRRKVLGFTVHIPLDPRLVQQVLLDNAANYAKPTIVKGLLAPVIGRGLLTSDGEQWRAQRRIVAASFTPPAIDALVPVFARSAQATAEQWGVGGLIDMQAQSTATTMRIIAESLFAGDERLTSPSAIAHIAAALEAFSGARVQALLGLPAIALTPKARRGRRGQIYLRKTLTQVVRDRQAGAPGDDFLGKLIGALHERFEPAEAEELAIDNAATFYLAGHETTANAISWTLFLLSEQPGLQDGAAEEAAAALTAGIDSLPDRVPLLGRIVEESMRLYPPAPRMDRQAVGCDILGEAQVEPADIVSVWPWLIHRSRRLWDDPDAFDADRFLPERKAARHRFQYIPFGGGPRTCVGARFATAEALVILAHWLSKWRFAPSPGRPAQVSGMVTLRPKGGLPLQLKRR